MQKRFTPDAGGVFPEWEEVRLGDIVELKNGYAFSAKTYDKKHDGKYNVLTIANVQSEKFVKIDNKTNTISELPKNIREHQKLKDGDLLISLTGNVGRVAINKGQNNLLNQRVGKLEIKDAEKVDSTFLYYVLNSDLFLKSMKCKGHGTAQKNLSKPDVEEFLFYMPCMEEQRKIAAALAAYDEMIAVKTAKLETWQECKKRMVKEIFDRTKRFRDDDGNEFPEWEEKTLGEVAELKNGYAFSSKSYDKNNSGDYKIITIGNLQEGKDIVINNRTKTVSNVPKNIKEHQILHDGDILVALTGATIGKVALNAGTNHLLNQRVGKIQIKDITNINNEFLYYIVNQEEFKSEMESKGHGSAQPNLSKCDVEGFSFFLPCIEEQQKIGSFLSEIDKEIEIQKEFIKTYAEGKKRMMRELMER